MRMDSLATRQNDVSTWIAATADGYPSAAYLWLVEPQLRTACAELQRNIPLDPSLLSCLLSLTRKPLTNIVEKTCVLELNIARIQGRVTNTRDYLRDGEVQREILARYPLLKVLIEQSLQQWQENARDFVERLHTDKSLVLALTGKPKRDEAAGVEDDIVGLVATGDTHAYGKQVLLVTFRHSGQVLYKPRSMAIDEQLVKLIDWFNLKGFQLGLKLPRVLARKTHGWAEKNEIAPCQTVAEVESFYHRLGAWLAILYAFGGKDFHFENFVTAGAFPVPVDLETFLHPLLNAPVMTASFDQAVAAKGSSVLAIGILPNIRGHGAAADEFRVPKWENVGSPEARLVRVPARRNDTEIEPVLGDAKQSMWTFGSHFERGFEAAYEILRLNRDEILDADLFKRLAATTVRVVVRPTLFYTPLLAESFHPHLLGAATARKAIFAPLTMAVASSPKMPRFIESEERQLEHGDVPSFYCASCSQTVTGGDGTTIPDILAKSAFDHAKDRIADLSPADFARQTWFIRTALASSAHARHAKAVLLPQAGQSWTGLEDAAVSIGAMLEQLAFVSETTATWLTHRKGELLGATPIGSDLYDGYAGIALFLAYLDHSRGRPASVLARKTAASIERSIDGKQLTGLFSGLSGHLFLFTHLAVLWRDSHFYELAENLVRGLSEIEPTAIPDLDIISGLAGNIGSAVACYRALKMPAALDLAHRHAAQICALQAEDGSWPGLSVKRGFSHGASGLAWALLQAHQLTGEDRFKTSALAALRFEQQLLSRCWTDWEETNSVKTQASWCHGAPGVALALATAQDVTQDSWLQNGLHAAISVTLATTPPLNHSLCHGLVGNLVLMNAVKAKTPDRRQDIDAFLIRGIAQLAAEVSSTGFATAAPGHLPTPGLMTGLSGMGLGLLHLAYPERVPNILCLEGPPGFFTADDR